MYVDNIISRDELTAKVSKREEKIFEINKLIIKLQNEETDFIGDDINITIEQLKFVLS
ncbi:hypothetical protein RJG79_10900 [Mycoplasmatota bacterium WC44]